MYRKNICRYFLKGACNKGDKCSYEHIKDNLLISEDSHNAIEQFIDGIHNKRVPNKNTDKYSKEGREKMKNNKPLHQSNKDKKRIKNTESFEPNHNPADMRVLVEVPNSNISNTQLQTQDVLIVPGLFGNTNDFKIYNNLLKEMEECGIENLWKLWHGDSHLIADDHRNYKERIPTFMMIINKIKEYFKMDIKATRFNWYRNDKEWKPFHHDASYIDPEKAKIQNFTVGVSFGATRDIAFEDAIENKGHRRIITFPLMNGTTYAFTRDINSNWRHGVPQLPENKQKEEGRISIIAWGFVNQEEAK